MSRTHSLQVVPLRLIVGAGVLGVAAVLLALADRGGTALALLVFGIAAVVAAARLDVAVALAVPAFLWDHGAGPAAHPTTALALGLATGAAIGGALPTLLRRWHLLVGPFAFMAWVLFAYLAPATSGPADGHVRSDVTALACGLILFTLAVAAAPSRRLLIGVLAASGSFTGWYAALFGTSYDLDHRISAFGLNPVFLAAALAIGAIACVIELRRGTTLLIALAVPGYVAGIVVTQSRAALIAVAVGLFAVIALWLLAGRPQRYGRRADIGLMVGFAGLAIALLVLTFATRTGGGFGRPTAEIAHNNNARGSAARLATETAFDHPFRGVGLGKFEAIAAASPPLDVAIAAHNEYLHLASETGFVGLGLFLASVAYLTFRGGRRDLDELAVPLTFLACCGFANLLFPVAVAAPFWAIMGARAARADPA
jgi:O-antigen ligase